MTERTTFSDNSAPPVGGPEFLGQYSERVKQLFDVSAIPLTSVSGTNTLTAVADPSLDAGGLVNGMKFTLTWPNTNTGGVTLSVNSGAAIPLVKIDGSAMVSGDAVAGHRALIEFLSGSFIILNAPAAQEVQYQTRQVFTTSGTWIKPAGLPDDRFIHVYAWQAGSNGTFSQGGKGGNFVYKLFPGSDVPLSVAVSVGAPSGGHSSFGNLLDTSVIFIPSRFGLWTGGYGGSTTEAPSGSGGNAAWGGGGGGTAANRGISVMGGNGGNQGVAGTAPGGGGGSSSALGATGEVWVII